MGAFDAQIADSIYQAFCENRLTTPLNVTDREKAESQFNNLLNLRDKIQHSLQLAQKLNAATFKNNIQSFNEQLHTISMLIAWYNVVIAGGPPYLINFAEPLPLSPVLNA